MDNLAANPKGGSGIYGQPGPDNTDVMGMVNQMKDREMMDFKNKANFMSDLSLKQDKMRALFNPDRLGLRDNLQPGQTMEGGPPNVQIAQDPNQMTGYQKGELGVRQQGLNLESQKIGQTGKLGQEAINVKNQQLELNQQKSNQIHEQKLADMQRKTNEADAKIQQAQAALESKNNNSEQTLQAHKDLAAAVEERHKLEIAQKDAQFQKKSEEHQQTIKSMEAKLKQGANTKTTTETNPDGTKRTVTTQKGDAADSVQVTGKDGKTYTIPKDKLNDMDADGTPHWKQQGGEDNNDQTDENG